MTDIRGPDDKDLAKGDYLNGMKYQDIADKYQVSINTIKSWVKRYNWSDEKKKRGAHKSKKGAPLNNKNAAGHGPPKENKNAEKHGFFSKYLPKETLSIIEEMQEKDQLDLLWDGIQIQYAVIIRAQMIMHVTSKDEMIKELKKAKYEVIPDKNEFKQIATELEYEFQFAWDRQATFLKAQSRAMAELRSLIKQYDELLNFNKDMATEEQKLRIEKLKVDIDKVKQDKGDTNGRVTIVDDIEGEEDGS